MPTIVVGQVEVPDLSGMTVEEAEAALAAAFLTAAYASPEYDDLIDVDLVLSQDPAATTLVEPNSEVTITLSAGVEPEAVGFGAGLITHHKRRRHRMRRRRLFRLVRA